MTCMNKLDKEDVFNRAPKLTYFFPPYQHAN